MEEKERLETRQTSGSRTNAVVNTDTARRSKSPNPSLTTSTTSKRIRKAPSSTSLSLRISKSKKAKTRPTISRNSSTLSVQSQSGISRNSSVRSAKHLQIPTTADDVATSSGNEGYDDSVMDSSSTPTKPIIAIGFDEAMSTRPDWTVRHRIYIDNELISTTTSTQRPGFHKFQDILLREQIETRLHTPHHGENSHFATRHATLRFWLQDGSLSEKWMDKDMGGDKEHEFAMENMNDWTILYLSIGGEDRSQDDGSEDMDEDTTVHLAEGGATEEAIMDDDDDDDDDNDDPNKDKVHPTMDIVSHYITDYHDARNIASAPGQSVSDDEAEAEAASASSPRSSPDTTHPAALERKDSVPIYHWVEERRRSLEHQLRTYFHCVSPSCFNKGGTCLAISPPAQHLHVGVKDLTDWSQQIAHANRSIAAATLHLAAKLIDGQVRAQDERLADVGREREDEDDLGEVLGAHAVLLAGMRPAGPDVEPVEMEMLD